MLSATNVQAADESTGTAGKRVGYGCGPLRAVAGVTGGAVALGGWLLRAREWAHALLCPSSGLVRCAYDDSYGTWCGCTRCAVAGGRVRRWPEVAEGQGGRV